MNPTEGVRLVVYVVVAVIAIAVVIHILQRVGLL